MRRMHWRSWVGLVVALPVIAVVLGIVACLPVPVGDPEKSKVDQKLVGGWLAKTDDAERELYVVRAFDARAYLVQGFNYKETNGVVEAKAAGLLKGWLTDLGGAQFITLQPLPAEEPLGFADKDAKQTWEVMKLEWKGAELTVRPVNGDCDLLKDVKTQAEAEKVITANVANDKIYDKAGVFRKVTEKDRELMGKVLDVYRAKGP